LRKALDVMLPSNVEKASNPQANNEQRLNDHSIHKQQATSNKPQASEASLLT